MRWLALSLAGPTLWAVVFSVVYAAHGMACASVTGPEGLGTAAHGVIAGLWLAGVVAHGGLLLSLPRGSGLKLQLPRAGAWIGLGATVFTLFPILLATSC